MARKTNSCPVSKGVLVVIGGAEDMGSKKEEKMEQEQDKQMNNGFQPNEVLKEFIGLMRKKSPLIEEVTSSGGEPEKTFNDYKKVFNSLGIRRVHHIHHNNRGEVLDDNLVKKWKKQMLFSLPAAAS